jgi:fatty-acyl-CoA synthase
VTVGQSLVRGPAEPPLLSLTIGQALDEAARRWGMREALICPAQSARFTWSELQRRSAAFAAGLVAHGLRPGDRIGVWSLNRWEWTVTQFAAAKAGLILVTVNPAYRLWELEYALATSGCAALVISPPFKTSDYAAMTLALAPELATCRPGTLAAARAPALRLVVQMGERTIGGALAFEEVEAAGCGAAQRSLGDIEAHLSCHDAVNIQFTSGTTGAPKGVTLSHHNILNNGYMVGRALDLDAEDRICIPVPLYHCFGMVMGNLASVTSGAAMVYPGEGLHRALRGADDVHRTAGSPDVRRRRPRLAQDRHHGGISVPRGDHAQGDRPDAHARGDDLLRHDRDQPGQPAERDERSAGPPRFNGGPRASARGSEDRRPPWRCG